MARANQLRIFQKRPEYFSNVTFSPIWLLPFSIALYPENTIQWSKFDKNVDTNFFTVSSFQIAFNCVPNIIIVKTENSNASNIKNNSRITVAGGEYDEHSLHSCLMHIANWLTDRNMA